MAIRRQPIGMPSLKAAEESVGDLTGSIGASVVATPATRAQATKKTTIIRIMRYMPTPDFFCLAEGVASLISLCCRGVL